VNPWAISAAGLVVAGIVLVIEWRLGIIGRRYREDD
jgi:hypothetical protein